MLPAAAIVDVVVMAPVVLMMVEPVMSPAPLIVPAVRTGAVRVLLVKVSVASRVTITPDPGYVAVEVTPVPPFADAKMPLTAALLARFILSKVGAPPPLGITST